jgi:hypothetical protein
MALAAIAWSSFSIPMERIKDLIAFFCVSSRVLYPISHDRVVFLLFCKVLCVILYPPANI